MTKRMRGHEILQVITDYYEPERIANELVSRARGKGETDDITAVVIEVEEW